MRMPVKTIDVGAVVVILFPSVVFVGHVDVDDGWQAV